MNKFTILILFILLAGIIFRLDITRNGDFIFHMDNGRDMVDVREMVILKKLRLIGPTSAIEGLFNGPAWYYLLAIPFILSGGDPYASIIMEIILWAIGGYFLLKLASRFGRWLIVPIGGIWVTSSYILLTNIYAFNPNPVTLLTPLFIYLLYQYLEKGRLAYIAMTWFLGGLFFNFEMNFGIFTPLIIFFSTFFIKRSLLKNKTFWIGSLFFILCLLPQLLFELKHQFFMFNSVTNFLRNQPVLKYDLFLRFNSVSNSFLSTFLPTIMNQKLLANIILILSVPVFYRFIRQNKKDSVLIISLLYIFIPFVGYLILPVSVNPWHLGGPMTASLMLIAYLIRSFWNTRFLGKTVAIILSSSIILFSLSVITNYIFIERGKPSGDPSRFKNEVAAIDYVYLHANGQNFKVYTYLPSVYDYPYQYLFWWYGQKKYGFIPAEYRYSPNKPDYIPSQNKFEGSKNNLSNLVFLIKEPDRIKMRQAWEDDFENMEFVSKEMLGPIEIEIRKELKKQ